MKKLLFSAIALVAFSSVSMGNTIEVKKLIETEKSSTKKIIAEDNGCLLAKFVAFNDSRAAGFSVADSTKNANSIFYLCMSLNLPKSVSIQ